MNDPSLKRLSTSSYDVVSTSDLRSDESSTPTASNNEHAPYGHSTNGRPLTAYEAAFKGASHAVKDGVKSSREAAQWASKVLNIRISKSTIAKAALDNTCVGRTPEKPSRKTGMPWSGELKLKAFIEALRAQKLPIFRETGMTYANRMLEGTVHATAFKDGKIDRY